jgi:transketolase
LFAKIAKSVIFLIFNHISKKLGVSMEIDNKSVDELRVLSAEMITNAKSGHPGIALGLAPTMYCLYANILAVDPKDPQNFNRDRVVLSAGHGSSLLYSTLYAMGFDLTVDDLKNFRQLGSKTPGHPEIDKTSGVDCNTGPLGQGIANAVGMAMAQKHAMAVYNKPDCKVIDGKIYCISGDGCLMEGVACEALSLAGNLNLDNFVLIYDCNKITIEGSTAITFTDDIKKRFEAINFDVLFVKDGNNTDSITKTLLKTKKSKRPCIVVVPTQIGYGSELAGSEKIHGKPLSNEQLEKLKVNLSVIKPDFDLSQDVKKNFAEKQKNASQRLNERNKTNEYKKLHAKEWKELKTLLDGKTYEREIEKIKKIKVDGSGATRDINHSVLTEIAEILPNLFGGSADVATSTQAYVGTAKDFSKQNYAGGLIRFGIREHAMNAICSGIALYGLNIPYESCFLSFVDYLKPALRMSALMNLRIMLTCSHDSILAGEDGPTHQPIEQIPSLRLIPNTIVSRPYNATEIVATYIWLLQNQKPTVMLVSKDKPAVEQSDLEKALCGAYVISQCRNASLTIVATGSDVSLALKIAENLKNKNIGARVVSMPCISIFEQQKTTYKKQVLKEMPTVFLEASAEEHWYKLAEKTDLVLNLHTFGTSAKPKDVAKYMNFDEISLEKQILSWLKKNN